MIDKEEARAIAQRALDGSKTQAPLMLDARVIDHPGYWVFPFNTVAYYETGDVMLMVVGGGPIAVSKQEGHVRFLTGAVPFEEQL